MTEAARTPPTARGQRSRARLVEAARVVFERDGFLDSKLADIAAEAGMAVGSFYTYFEAKEDVLVAVLEALREEMVHPPGAPSGDEEDPVAAIEAANRAYLESYRTHARLMAVQEQMSMIDERMQELKRRRIADFGRRNGRSIADMQRRGLVDPALDPYLAAAALSHMVSRMAYQAFVAEEGWTLDELVDGLSRLWANALGLARTEG